MANWIAVASAEHVRRGIEGGFMQVCHGKAGPLRRIRPGDVVAYYSPSETFGRTDRLQAFTAIGRVREGEPYVFDMGDSFRPFRRDVVWADATPAPIRPLLDALEFTAGNPNWGYRLRFGVLEISEHDFAVIARSMGATGFAGALRLGYGAAAMISDPESSMLLDELGPISLGRAVSAPRAPDCGTMRARHSLRCAYAI